MTLPYKTTAFTLIELLTVIVIIGILAAIIIPTVGKVRETAASATTLSNLRELATGVHLYANDNKGFAPSIVNDNSTLSWAQMLVMGGYLGVSAMDINSTTERQRARYVYYVHKFTNPTTRRKQDPATHAASLADNRDDRGCFGMNTFRANVNRATNIQILSTPSRMVLFADGFMRDDTRVGWPLVDSSVAGAVNGGNALYPNTWSGGSAHYAFVDGSARKIRAQNPDDRNSPPVGLNETVFFVEPQ